MIVKILAFALPLSVIVAFGVLSVVKLFSYQKRRIEGEHGKLNNLRDNR